MMVSVIMPIYNTARFLPMAIESVCAQTYSDWELILVDDGSTDESLVVCRAYASRDARIRVLTQANRGVSAARSLGLAQARGRYVTFMDSDDELVDRAFAMCAERAERSDSDMIFFSIEFVSQNGAPAVCLPPLEDGEYRTAEYMRTYIDRKVMYLYSNANKWYRRSLIEAHGIRFAEGMQFGEDRLFNYEFLRYARRLSAISDRLYRYYLRNNGSLSSRYIGDMMAVGLALHRAKIEMLEPYFADEAERVRYAQEDLKYEFFHAVDHLIAQWDRLSGAERRQFCRRMVGADYPSWFWQGSLRSRNLRIFRYMLKRRQPDLVYALVWCRRLKKR